MSDSYRWVQQQQAQNDSNMFTHDHDYDANNDPNAFSHNPILVSAPFRSGNSSIESFSSLYSSPPAEWDFPAFQPQDQLPRDPSFHPSHFRQEQQPYFHPHPQSLPASPPQHPFPQYVQQPPHVHSYGIYPNMANPSAKRSRDTFDIPDDDLDLDPISDAKVGVKIKTGACGRCKDLKVKCEFITESEPCKRCATSGQQCYIPGRKKRRTPPKREDLLNQIKDQARQIQDLMGQLESCGKKWRRRPSSAASSDFLGSSSGLESPLLTPPPSASAESDPHGRQAIEDWIAKAKQSLQDFDVFIGAGLPKRYIVHDDNDSGDEYYSAVGTDEYDIAVQNPDGQEISTSSLADALRHKSSTSSIGTRGTGYRSRKNAIERAKPAILPNEEVPFGLFGQLSLETARPEEGPEPEEADKTTGIARKDFFKPSPTPRIDQHLAVLRHAPPILTRKIITPQESERLFQIYFDNINLSVSLLDPVLYTPHNTFYRSPFLFTVICAISSRFYADRPDLYSQLLPFAKQSAGWALIHGAKNVEMCAAYILLSLYPEPKKKWEDQRGWLFLGLAIRTATDLNLNLPITAKFTSETHAREMLNRTRIWLNCFNLDRSTGSQYGKPPIICINDYMAKNSENWWKSSPYNMKNFDIHICAYNAELQVMGRFLAQIYQNPLNPTGLNKDAEKIATDTDEELKQLQRKWMETLKEADVNDVQNNFRSGLLKLAYPYARLIALSYGFQHAFGNSITTENPFLTRCLDAAFDVVIPVLEDLCQPSQRIYLRHGPEAQSVFITFASAFLVKLLQPKFSSFLPLEKRREIRQLVKRVVDLLGSSEIAIDDRHGPKLYSKFLRNLLAAPMARVDPLPVQVSSSHVRSNSHNYDQNAASASNVAALRMASSSESPGKQRPAVIPAGTSTPSRPSALPPSAGVVATAPTMYTRSSTSPRSTSLSPPPRAAAASFNNFAPSGGLDPFAPDPNHLNQANLLYVGSESLGTTNARGENSSASASASVADFFFNPPLPGYDEDMFQRIQLLSEDPTTAWQEGSLNQTLGLGHPNPSLEALERDLNTDFQVQENAFLYNNYFLTDR